MASARSADSAPSPWPSSCCRSRWIRRWTRRWTRRSHDLGGNAGSAAHSSCRSTALESSRVDTPGQLILIYIYIAVSTCPSAREKPLAPMLKTFQGGVRTYRLLKRLAREASMAYPNPPWDWQYLPIRWLKRGQYRQIFHVCHTWRVWDADLHRFSAIQVALAHAFPPRSSSPTSVQRMTAHGWNSHDHRTAACQGPS